MAQEALNHRIHLVSYLQLVEVAGPDGSAMHDGRQPLRHAMRRIERWCRGQMQRRDLALRRHGRAVECDVPPRKGLVLTIVGESRATVWRPHWATVAAAAKPLQTVT
jgi:hypothetical protein